jgi:hypothetical protein
MKARYPAARRATGRTTRPKAGAVHFHLDKEGGYPYII